MVNIDHFNKDKLTFGEVLDPAMKVKTKEEAETYFEAYVNWICRTTNLGRKKAEEIARSNIGYFTGYYDQETAARCHRLYGFGHPIFGNFAKTPPPTLEEAFKAGIERGKKARKS